MCSTSLKRFDSCQVQEPCMMNSYPKASSSSSHLLEKEGKKSKVWLYCVLAASWINHEQVLCEQFFLWWLGTSDLNQSPCTWNSLKKLCVDVLSDSQICLKTFRISFSSDSALKEGPTLRMLISSVTFSQHPNHLCSSSAARIFKPWIFQTCNFALIACWLLVKKWWNPK